MPSSCDFPVSTKKPVKPVKFCPEKCRPNSILSQASNDENPWPSEPSPCDNNDPDNEKHKKNYSNMIQSLNDRNITSLEHLQYIFAQYRLYDQYADSCKRNLLEIGVRVELLHHYGIRKVPVQPSQLKYKRWNSEQILGWRGDGKD
ncbi:MAG: hypothetical protein HETSPECPRED_002112 [Heterodermia speciosa]|uniref:Uncharacterized protein n=1 Tax=Heterodermia speciosa TaxID=116794 RepID=A0A8H3J3C6_9LECA|nr:MAG: hypothetical protein HETSPECPRED_002112 [Heterodermia speciosa]